MLDSARSFLNSQGIFLIELPTTFLLGFYFYELSIGEKRVACIPTRVLNITRLNITVILSENSLLSQSMSPSDVVADQ